MESARKNRILELALPIVGGMLSQNFLNLVDTAMVGRYGDAALAAVGFGSFAFFIGMALVTGIAVGVQTIAARRLGQGATEATAMPLNGGLALAVICGIPMMLLLMSLVDVIVPWFDDDPQVREYTSNYLSVRIVAVVAVGMNHSFRGYWNGVNLSKLYMQTLVFMHLLNVFLNWVFIFGNLGAPEMGVTGAALASAVATACGTLFYVQLGFRYAKGAGFLAGMPSMADMMVMLKLAIPAGIQQLAFFLGMIAFLIIVGRIGTSEVAALNVLIQLYLVVMFPAFGFGLAGASLVSQALGRSDPEDAAQWGWDTAKIATMTIGTAAMIALFFPGFVLDLFALAPQTRALALFPLQITAATVALDTVGLVLMNTLLGAGATNRVLIVAVLTQWGFFLPAAYIVGPQLGYGLLGVWLCQLAYRAIQTFCFVVMWHRRKWTEITI